MTNQPIFILPEGYQRTRDRDAQKINIDAAKAVSDIIRTTLGPKGMDKMLVDSVGDITITNDGATILKEMQIENPAAKMIVEVAKTQEEEVGDGTTTAVVLAGELLKKAESLIDLNVHPTIIIRGYKLATEKSLSILNQIAEKVSIKDKDILIKIALTAMTGKGAESAKAHLSKLIVDAVLEISEDIQGNIIIDKNYIKIEKKTGGSTEDSEIIQGVVLDKEKVHPGMPLIVEKAKIALIDSALEIKNPEIDAKIQITDPSQIQAFLDQEEQILKGMIDKIVLAKANVVICQKGIDDIAQHYLAKAGIYAVRRVTKSDMEKLAKATGGNIVTNLDSLNEKDLGYAGVVEEKRVGDDEATYVRNCKNPKSVTILLRGGTSHVVDEIERATEDVIGDLVSALRVGKVVAGGGACEVELSTKLRKYSNSLSGKEQLAVQAFADAIEIIPRTLAENSGLDPIDILTKIKAQHDKDKKWAGIDVFSEKIVDSWKAGVIEPLNIKTQAITSASEVASLILRIDDIIASSGSKDSGGPMMPPGGMPPMM